MMVDESDNPLPAVGGVTAVDGGMLGTIRGKSAQPTGLRLTPAPYYLDPIAGLQPPIGHPHSPYTNPQIEKYIHSLQRLQACDSSVVAEASSSSDSDDTYATSENPMVRLPIRTKVSPTQKGVSPVVTSKKEKNRKNAAAYSHRGRTMKGAQAPHPPGNPDLINLSPTNLPLDDFVPEKEVCEEKEYPAVGRGKEEKERQKRRGVSLGAKRGTQKRRTSRSRERVSMLPPTTPNRYNLRSRSRTTTPVPSPQ